MLSLNELGLPYIYVDLRKFEEKGFASYRDLVVELEREVNRLTSRFPASWSSSGGSRGLRSWGAA
jgi:hypothetical protein